MTSIHTNNAAMVALESLRSINTNMAKVQKEVSTGYKIADSADNAAIWAVSAVMRADVAGFETISESLSLGKATVSVARNASEKITELLEEVKTKVIAAQEENVDRTKIQTDIVELRSQISSIVESAQFNGLNLLDGSVATPTVDILSSLNRSATTVSVGQISVGVEDLSITAGNTLTTAAASIDVTTIDENGGADDEFVFTASQFLQATGGVAGAVALTADTTGVDKTATGGMLAGDVIELTLTRIDDSGATDVTLASFTARYTVREGDTVAAVAAGVKDSILDAGVTTDLVTFGIAAGALTVTNQTNDNFGVAMSVTRGSGGLSALNTFDMTNAASRANSLGQIETMIQLSIDTAASFGSSESRLDIQAEFVTSLVDSFKSGIGALVDAELEEASARLQALQVQQQLGTQSLSIANSNPQNVLALFG